MTINQSWIFGRSKNCSQRTEITHLFRKEHNSNKSQRWSECRGKLRLWWESRGAQQPSHLSLEVMFIIGSEDKLKTGFWLQAAQLVQIQQLFDIRQVRLQRNSWNTQTFISISWRKYGVVHFKNCLLSSFPTLVYDSWIYKDRWELIHVSETTRHE